MKAYEEQVVEEKSELDQKISALAQFTYGNEYKDLAMPERERLVNQLKVMHVYSYILGQRISNFE